MLYYFFLGSAFTLLIIAVFYIYRGLHDISKDKAGGIEQYCIYHKECKNCRRIYRDNLQNF